MRRPKVLVATLFAGVLVVTGALILYHRVELFVLSPLLREVVRLDELQEKEEDPVSRRALQEELEATLLELIRLQRPAFESGMYFSVDPMRTEEGREAYVVSCKRFEPPVAEEPELLEAGRHYLALDARGRVLGDEFQAPPWPNAACYGQGHRKAAVAEGRPDVLLIAGDVGCAISVDAKGIVPRGVLLQSALDPPGEWALHASTGTSAAVARWLESLRELTPSPERIARQLSSTRTGDLFRALSAIERLGPHAARDALPLLAHRDPDVRARAAAVIGNDPALWETLVPLSTDEVKRVRTSARLALLGAASVDAARQAFVALIREDDADALPHADFDLERLLSPEVAAVLFDELVKTGYIEERFLWALRSPRVRPLLPRLLEVWRDEAFSDALEDDAVRTGIAVWLVRLDEPELDELLAAMLREQSPANDAWFGGSSVAEKVLTALVERKTPLRGEGAVEALRRIAENSRSDVASISAYLLLARRDVPGALEGLLGRLVEDESWVISLLPEAVEAELESLLETAAAQPRYESEIRRIRERESEDWN